MKKKISGALAAGILALALSLTIQSLARPGREVPPPEERADRAVAGSPAPTLTAMAAVSASPAPAPLPEPEPAAALEPTPEPISEPEPAPASLPEMEEDKVEMLACVIYQEAGGDKCSDLCRKYVGDVVLNRIDDLRFPDTMEGVLTAEYQYGRFHWTGIAWPERAKDPDEAAAVERAYRIARELLAGEHSEIYGAGYVWQAEFEQGQDVIYLDGLCFGR